MNLFDLFCFVSKIFVLERWALTANIGAMCMGTLNITFFFFFKRMDFKLKCNIKIGPTLKLLNPK